MSDEIWCTYRTSHPSGYYTYVYRDPLTNNEPIYVGKGKGKRAYDHLERTDSHPLVRRLGWMKRRNVLPNIEIIPALNEDHAFFLEVCLIAIWGRVDKKTGTLHNLTDGGDGVANPSEECRAALSARMKKLHSGKEKSAAHRLRIKAKLRAHHNSDARDAVEIPQFQQAMNAPVIHLTRKGFVGQVNVLATARQYGLNFKRFNKWVKNHD